MQTTFAPGTLITFKLTPDAPEHETQTGVVISVGTGTLTAQLSDGSKVGLAIDHTVQRVEETTQESNAATETGQNGPIKAGMTKDSQVAETGEIFGAMTAKEETMTEQQQNEVLARWLSERIGSRWYFKDGWFYPSMFASKRYAPPTASLDSMALIEGAMNGLEAEIYCDALRKVIRRSGKAGFDAQLICAPAAQRAEAACRALGLWKDGEN